MTVVVYWVVKTILGPILRSLYRPWVRGAEHVPSTGGAILASNHLSFVDSIFLPLVLRRRVTFLAKMEYFTGRGVSGRAKAVFFRGVGQVPVDRSGGRASVAAIDSGLRILRRGELLGLYPEGTRSPDGRLYRGKTGVARIALESRCPVIPVAMIGTDKVQPAGRTLWSIRRVGIIIGRPLDFSRYEGMADDRHVTRSVTDEIVYELMRLSGQEYVDEYASVVKDRIAEEKLQRVVGDVLDTVTRITGRDTSKLTERLFGDDLAPGDYTATADDPRDRPGPRAESLPEPEAVPAARTSEAGRRGAPATPASRLEEAMDAGEVAITAAAVAEGAARAALPDGGDAAGAELDSAAGVTAAVEATAAEAGAEPAPDAVAGSGAAAAADENANEVASGGEG